MILISLYFDISSIKPFVLSCVTSAFFKPSKIKITPFSSNCSAKYCAPNFPILILSEFIKEVYSSPCIPLSKIITPIPSLFAFAITGTTAFASFVPTIITSTLSEIKLSICFINKEV